MNKEQFDKRVAGLNEKLIKLKNAVEDLKEAKKEQAEDLKEFIEITKNNKDKSVKS